MTRAPFVGRGAPYTGRKHDLVGRRLVLRVGMKEIANVGGFFHYLLRGSAVVVVSTPQGGLRLRQVDPCGCGALHEVTLAHRARELPPGFAFEVGP